MEAGSSKINDDGRKSNIYDYLMKLMGNQSGDDDDDEIKEELEELGLNDLDDPTVEVSDKSDDNYDELEDIIIERELQNTIKNLKGSESESEEDDELLRAMGFKKKKETEKIIDEFDLQLFESVIEYNRHMRKVLEKLECFLILKQRQLELNSSDTVNYKKSCKFYEREFHYQFSPPYFRDGVFPSPPNPEQKLKAKVNCPLYMNTDLNDTWDSAEMVHVEDAVRDLFVDDYFKKNESPEGKNRTQVLNKLKFFRNSPLDELISEDNAPSLDWDIISAKMPRPHSSKDCESIWNIYLCPSINKSPWSRSENKELKQIAKNHNFRNWQSIAEKLNTGRSGYLCFLQYRRKLETSPPNSWTDEETSMLYKVVEACKVGGHINWVKVNYYFDSHSLFDIYTKYVKCFNLNFDFLPRKGKFQKFEDQIIVKALAGGISMRDVPKFLPSRNPAQIWSRATTLTQLDKKIGGWTKEEDMQLIALVEEFGTSNWAEIAKRIKGRTRVQVRQHYSHIQKMLRMKPYLNFDSYRTRPTNWSDRALKRKNRFYRNESQRKLTLMKNDQEENDIIKYFRHEQKVFEPRQSISTTFDANRDDILTMVRLLGGKLKSKGSANSEDKFFKEYIYESFKFVHKNRLNLSSIRPLSNEVTLLPPNVLTFSAFRNIYMRLNEEKYKFSTLGDPDIPDDPASRKAYEDWYKRLLILFSAPFCVQNMNLDQFNSLFTKKLEE